MAEVENRRAEAGMRERHVVRAGINMEVGVDLTEPWPLVKGSRTLVISIHQGLRRELWRV